MGVSGTFRRADAMPRDEEDPLIRRADANVKEEPEAARAALYSARLSKLYMVYCGLFVLVTLTLIAWLTASIFVSSLVCCCMNTCTHACMLDWEADIGEDCRTISGGSRREREGEYETVAGRRREKHEGLMTEIELCQGRQGRSDCAATCRSRSLHPP
eukprot:GHVU01076910.1.p1 GENE.GHVU01076910.1~~GHVU01076910.1.p1  ORF type:complete len:158 (+),score=13.87 GHVU01076910.1:382-855(+)